MTENLLIDLSFIENETNMDPTTREKKLNQKVGDYGYNSWDISKEK